MPWQSGDSVPPSWWTAWSIALAAAAFAAWMVRCIPAPKSWMLVAVAMALCFTGSAAVALHEVAFDPLTPSFAMLLGALGGWFMHRQPAAERLAEEAVETRPVHVLTVGLVDEAALRSRLGPVAFLALAGSFRKRASSLLQARQAHVLPGSGDSLQACFGVPHATETDAENAAQTAMLLARALEEFFRQQSSPAPVCSIALKHGFAVTGRVEGRYEVAGEVLDECRQLWTQAGGGAVITDAATAGLLPESLLGVEIRTGLWQLMDKEGLELDSLPKPDAQPSSLFIIETEFERGKMEPPAAEQPGFAQAEPSVTVAAPASPMPAKPAPEEAATVKSKPVATHQTASKKAKRRR